MDYKVIVSSGNDAIIRKEGPRSCSDLVLLFSQKMFFIYDRVKEIKQIVKNESTLRNFFTEKNNNDKVIPSDTFSFVKNHICKGDLYFLSLAIETCLIDDTFYYLLKRQILKINDVGDIFDWRNNSDKWKEYYKNDPKLLKLLLPITGLRQPDPLYCFIMTIYSSFGYDILKKVLKYGILPHFKLNEITDLSKYNLNPTMFANYLTDSEMGEECMLSSYIDYLDMAYQYDGKVKDKYPVNVMTMHDKYSFLINEKNRIKKDYPEFSSVMSECEDFSYISRTEPYCIIMPEEAKDLIQEGSKLGHCVGSYAEKVINGDCVIVFMREKSDPDVPYLTVEISKGRRISEIEGKNKRTELSDDEILFIKRFAKNKNLAITAPNALRSIEKKSA